MKKVKVEPIAVTPREITRNTIALTPIIVPVEEAVDDLVENGLVEAQAPEPGPDIEPLHKLTIFPGVSYQVAPVYPERERRRGVEATCLAQALIDARGNVLEVKIVESAGAAFDEAVKNALMQTKFTPGYVGDRAVAVQVQIPFHFKLH